MNVSLNAFAPAAFVVPQNPILDANIPQTGNPVVAEVSMGCLEGTPCHGQVNGLGEFEVLGFNAPGKQWMYLVGIGLIAGAYFMSDKGA